MELEPWLASLSLKKNYYSKFVENGFTHLDEIKSLNKSDLKDIGIDLLADVKKIEAGIKKLNDPTPARSAIGNIPLLGAVYQHMINKPTKTLSLLFIGETGAGKTTLINSLYFLGLSKPLSAIEALVTTKYLRGKTEGSESNLKNTQQSQTTKAQVHTFTIETTTTKYTINIMDTPGIGDTRGIAQDDANILQIVETVEKTPELNAVFLILNGTNPRLTNRMEYVIHKMRGMLPNVFRENLFLILTNCPLQSNLEIDKATLDISNMRQFPMDNAIFAIDIQKASPYQLNILENLWNQFRANIVFILDEVAKLKGVKTDAFAVIRENRGLLQIQIKILQEQTKTLVQKRNDLTNIKAQLEKASAGSAVLQEIKRNSVKQAMVVQFVDTPYHNTVCAACDYSKQTNPKCCHEKCGLDFSTTEGDNIFKSCQAIGWFSSGECRATEYCKHHFSRHYHIKKKPVAQMGEISVFTAQQMKEFEDAVSKEKLMEQLVQTTCANLLEIEAAKRDVERGLLGCYNDLRRMCSDFNYKRELDLSLELIEESLVCATGLDEQQLLEVKRVMQEMRKVFELESAVVTTLPQLQ